ILIMLATGTLQACLDPATVTTTSAQMIYNRNKIKKSLDDAQITAQAYQKIYVYNDRYKNTNVSISTFNTVVLVAGQIPDPTYRKEIDQIVRNISGVTEVYNLTTLTEPSS